jgi:hypothetical protein
MRWRSSCDRGPAERRRHPPRRADPAGTGWCVGGCRDGRRRKRRGRTPPEATKAEFSSGLKSVSNELRGRLRGRSFRVGALKIPVGRVERPYGQPRGDAGPPGSRDRAEIPPIGPVQALGADVLTSVHRVHLESIQGVRARCRAASEAPPDGVHARPSRAEVRSAKANRPQGAHRALLTGSDALRGEVPGARFLPYRHGVTLRLGPGGKRLSVVIPRSRGISRTSIRALAAPLTEPNRHRVMILQTTRRGGRPRPPDMTRPRVAPGPVVGS